MYGLVGNYLGILPSLANMKITKLGHCCLLIQTKGLTILTDPGNFSKAQDTVVGIDVVLITHEHADHFHLTSLQAVLKNNPEARVFTNSSVGQKLAEVGIAFTLLEGQAETEVGGVALAAFDHQHEEIFEEVGQVQNTGYFIDNRLFYPGDAFCEPGRAVEILALPVAGPWCRIAAAIRYALSVAPKKVFPVHDGMLILERRAAFYIVPEKVLAEKGIEFVNLEEGDEKGF